jgi:DNA-binding NtrC family response regulator
VCAEWGLVIFWLGLVNGNISKAAEFLGVIRQTLYDLMDKCGLRT